MQLVTAMVAGGFGALINCALANYFSSQFDLLQEIFLQPVEAMKTLLYGFFGGTLVVLVWEFLKIRMVRYLLKRDTWFLHPKRPLNKLWMLLVLVLLGRKDKGSLQYQRYLPSYPLPALKDTCRKYLSTVKPLLTEEEYSNTEKAVKKFQNKEGKSLQFILSLRAFRNRNWMHEWWVNYVYLKQRTPTCLNSNYFATGGPTMTTHSQLDRAAMMLYSTAKFFINLRRGKEINPRAAGIAPFCMDGHRYLHCTYREPGEEIDKIVNYALVPGATLPTHIVLIRRGKFYKLEIFSPSGELQTPLGIRRGLEKIVEMAGDENDERGVATFTSLSRTKWAKIFQRMREKGVNRRTLDAIGSSIALLALETEATDMKDIEQQAKFLFHGNLHNRWFDKCVIISVASSAVVGANVEHTVLDATVASQLWEYILTDEEYDERGHVLEPFRNCRAFEGDPPIHLKWDLEGLEDDLEQSKVHLREMISDSDMVLIKTYGKEIPKQCRLSPDGWFQMAMQLAHYRKYKQCVLTYESATTRLYYKGRTETIRPVTEKSVQFCKSFDDPNVSREDVKKFLKDAINLQYKYKMEAMRGLGVDRHLFGLYCVAKGSNMDPLPDIFQDKAFNLSFLLSTSQTPVCCTDRWRLELSSLCGGFGTVTNDGYGVSYLVYDDHVVWTIHSWHSRPRTSSREFGNCIKEAMDDMRKLYSL